MMRWILTLSFLWIGCHPLPEPPVPNDDDADAMPPSAADCVHACDKLHWLGCLEGSNSCLAVCQHVVDSRLTPLDPACIARAESVSEILACAGGHCTLK